MSKIEHRDGMWYKNEMPWYSGEFVTGSFIESEIRRYEDRIAASQEALEDWREIQRIRSEEEAERKADAGIEKLTKIIKRAYDPLLYPRAHDRAVRAVRDEVLRMVARGELEVPKDV